MLESKVQLNVDVYMCSNCSIRANNIIATRSRLQAQIGAIYVSCTFKGWNTRLSSWKKPRHAHHSPGESGGVVTGGGTVTVVPNPGGLVMGGGAV